LEDENTFQDYSIQDDSTLDLSLRPLPELQMFVKTLTGKHITLKTRPTDWIKDVTAKVQDEQSINIDLHRNQVPEFRNGLSRAKLL
jgi:ubiquitin C